MPATRRGFLATSAGAALAAAFVRPARSWACGPQGQEPVFTPIRRNVGYFTMRGGTIGYLVNDGAVAVVDSQFPPEARACLEGLNSRSGNRPVDFLVNTHHHGDHTGGNVSFRGAVKAVVSHARAAEHMRQPPGGEPPADQLFPDTTFTERWDAPVGDERIRARHYGPAHTGGDAVITFERANVVHMGDLMFHARHPVVDRGAGATMRNWITVLERTVTDHSADTVYIFGHSAPGLPVTGDRTDLLRLRDYLGAVLTFVDSQVRAGRSREEILAMRDPLRGFESFGPFGRQNPRDPLTCAYEEITAAAP